jgi:hypothetical protein
MLIILVVCSFVVKVYPPLTHDFLVNFDSIYHTRIGNIVAQTGWVPAWDYVAGGRPHLYPPLYHLLLGYTSSISGAKVFELVQYILPLVSALLAIPVFFLIRKYRSGEIALLGAAFMALSPIVASQSYDSPHLFGLLLFPLIVYTLLKSRYYVGGGLLAITILFNYGIAVAIIAVMAIFSLVKLREGNKSFLLNCGLIIALGLGLASPWLLISLARSGECFDPSTAVVGVNEAATGYLWTMAPFIALLGFGLLYLLRRKNDNYLLFWKVAYGLGTAGFLASLFVPELHPYDQILLFGFSMPFLLADLKWRRVQVALLPVFAIGLVLSVMAVVTVVSQGEIDSANWVAENVDEGNIVADVEVSSMINMFAMREPVQTV